MTDSRKKTRPALLALAAALPLTAGLVFAAGTSATNPQPPQRVQPAQPGQTGAQPAQTRPQAQTRTHYADVFLQKLAAQLGISVDRLRAAATSAGNATIDQGVQAGDIPQDRAADLKARMKDAPLNFGFGGRHGRGGPGAGPVGERGPRTGAGGPALTAAVAQALGLSEQALRQQLQQGQTVAQIAQARGVGTQTVRNAALAALKTQLAAQVQAGRLTQAQADQMLARAQADANFGLEFGRGGRGGHDRDGQNGPRGLSQSGDQGT
ncbi:hypothetical protein DEIPH_ctg001orf0045 [Deinococcus phoenicis]|uniref:Uncharacterized protein n=1 Tax=Deinococcus phoenicis TaxID=1476583 RepID=A0A016QVJ8_9DEIO|nr:hypothetical protein [Deinococcus phoenicis]EYB69829.1 hypothetical protein DEIPH_ctg001orf0045 [Deinococcus phoenicis]